MRMPSGRRARAVFVRDLAARLVESHAASLARFAVRAAGADGIFDNTSQEGGSSHGSVPFAEKQEKYRCLFPDPSLLAHTRLDVLSPRIATLWAE